MECRHDSGREGPGILYLVATPIGNLEDMTYRAVRILSEVDLIAAEDTRHTRKLLSHYGIHTRLTSYHEHNKQEKGPKLIDCLLGGESLACVSDAGLPGIADPGSHLVQLAIDAGIRVVPLPGANAALPALICSGLDTTAFSFAGFLPRTGRRRRELLERLRRRQDTLIFYEAPHHIQGTLRELADVLGADRTAVIARELTKCHEEFQRGTLGELCCWCESHEPRGEFVLLISGCREELPEERDAEPRDPAEVYREQFAARGDRKEALRETAKQLGLSRREVYRMVNIRQEPDE